MPQDAPRAPAARRPRRIRVAIAWGSFFAIVAVVSLFGGGGTAAIAVVVLGYLLLGVYLTAESADNPKWSDFSRNVVLGGAVALIISVVQVIVDQRRTTRETIRALSQQQDLRGVDLRGEQLREAHLSGKPLDGADLRGAHLRDATLFAATLRRADLRKADLRDANLGMAQLGNADLENARLEGADLRQAQLGHALLYGAHLRGARLEGAHLEFACLAHADLTGADLTGAHVLGAVFTGADVDHAVFERDLRPALDLDRAGFAGATGADSAVWPFDFDRGARPGSLLDVALDRSVVSVMRFGRVRVDRVYDGDTMRVVPGPAAPGVAARVRLFGIDAPDLPKDLRAPTVRQRREAAVGVQARDRVRSAVEGRTMRIAVAADFPGGSDVFGRTVAWVVAPDGTLLNETLIERGLATVQVDADERGRYSPAEQELRNAEIHARRRGLGLWQVCASPG